MDVLNDLKAVDNSYIPDPSIMRIHPGFRTHKYDTEMIDDPYDPTLADYTGDGMRLTASERNVLREIIAIAKAKKSFEDGDCAEAVDLLKAPIDSFPQPGVLTLRAKAYLEVQEAQKALADAEAALKLDMNFHEALLVRAKSLATMGLYAKARQAFEGYLELVPDDDEACDLFSSLAGKNDRPMTADESAELVGDDPAYYAPESLESAAWAFTMRAADKLQTAFKGKKGKYKPSIQQDLRHRFVKAEGAMFNRLTALENELRQKEAAMTSTSDNLASFEEELAQVKSELKTANKTNNRLTKHNEELQARVDASISEGTDPLELKRLKDELAEKDKALSHASKVYDGLLRQYEDLKTENDRLKVNRASKKAETRINDEASEELEKLKEEHLRTRSQLEEARKTQTQVRADLTKKLQDAEGAHQEKLRRVRAQLQEAGRKANEEANRAAQLAALLEDEKRTSENLTVQVNEQLDASVTATCNTPSTTSSVVHGAGLEGLVGTVFATLFSFPDGIMLEPLKQAVREDAEIDGEEEARKCGYASFADFLQSEEMAPKISVYYEAKPDPCVQHLRDAQEESGRHAREKLKKQLFFERKRVDNLGRQLKAAEEQVARKQTELAKKDEEIMLQPLCPVCWLRQCDTTFEVPEPKGAICGHLICLHCANGLSVCHFCRKKIVKRVKLYTGQSRSSSA